MKRRIIFLLLGVAFFTPNIRAQEFALKTNLLYWSTTTLNIGAELSVSDHSTIQAFYGVNPWTWSEGKSIRHWAVQPEYKYWFCGVFDGWFIGVHALGGQFNWNKVKLPFGLSPTLRKHRYEGWFAGGGISGGYQWALSKHWGIESNLGVGYAYIKYKKYQCGACGEQLKRGHTHYVGPTQAGVSFLYIF